MDRRHFLASTMASLALPGAGLRAASSAMLEEATLDGLAAAFAAGRLTSLSMTLFYLDRIRALDRAGPALRAVIETNPAALDIAAALDKERQSKGLRGPLHGIPVLIKDNVETSDRMMTTAGSLALEGWYSPEDAPLAARLRAAGAVILGKANMSEWRISGRRTPPAAGAPAEARRETPMRSTDRPPAPVRIGDRRERQSVRRGHRH